MRGPGGLPRRPVRAVAGLSRGHQAAGPLAALRQLLAHVRHLERYRSAGWLDNRQAWLLDRLGSYLTDGPTLYTESRRFLEQALELRRSELGAEHPDTLASMNNLALTLHAQGDLAGARGLQEQVLDLRRRVLGAEDPETFTAMNNLAGTLWAQGDLASARGLQEHVLDLHRRVLGAEHPHTLNSMNNLAGTLGFQGDRPGARRLQEQVLDTQRRVMGMEHPQTSISAFSLLVTLIQASEWDSAGSVFTRHLAWLLERKPATLGAYQRHIREQLVAHYRLDSPSDAE